MQIRLHRLALPFLFLSTTLSYSEEAIRALVPEKHFAVFDKYCLECHDSLTEKGGIDLEALSFGLDTVESAETWQKVLNVMNSGEMPPEEEKQLSFEEKSAFLTDLSRELVVARELLSDTGGVITMRRLNRREYENTIEDLLSIRINADALPNDANSGGFDTDGSALFFSSGQFEQYLALAKEALDAAFVFGDRPEFHTFKRESETAVNLSMSKTVEELEDQYERAQEWRANAETKAPSDYGFIDENNVKTSELVYSRRHHVILDYLNREESKTGALLVNLRRGPILDEISLPEWPPEEYKLTVRAGYLPGAEPHQRFLEYGTPEAGAMWLLGCVEVTGSFENPQELTIPITFQKNGARNFALRQRLHNNESAIKADFLQHEKKHGVGPRPVLWIDSVKIEGPFIEDWPPEKVSEIFFKGLQPNQNDEDTYAKEIIERFATKAFRIKKPSKSFLERLHQLYLSERANGEEFVEAIREPLAVVMATPGFLYILEPVSGSEKRELTDLEMAVRLSYFLWSAPPDKDLYAAAKSGRLKERAELNRQTNRMLDDPRSDAFIEGFTHQWLHMERLNFFQFDYSLYPQFDDSTKAAARQEVYETIRSVLDEKRPIRDLLKSDHVMVNDLLANYYGLEGVRGSEFQKVSLPENSPRGGLLGMAAVHAMGSDGTHSSLVERGAWVMRYLLNDPPPPAPPNVPQLSRVQDKLLSPREELSSHMEEAQCASCHSQIDPVGYGLQNFDAAGNWREELTLIKKEGKKVIAEKQVPVDASGTLPNGSSFANFFELRSLVAERDDSFSRSFAESLIEYALGRPYGFSDEALREEILEHSNSNDGQMREIVIGLIQSKAFQTKK